MGKEKNRRLQKIKIGLELDLKFHFSDEKERGTKSEKQISHSKTSNYISSHACI